MRFRVRPPGRWRCNRPDQPGLTAVRRFEIMIAVPESSTRMAHTFVSRNQCGNLQLYASQSPSWSGIHTSGRGAWVPVLNAAGGATNPRPHLSESLTIPARRARPRRGGRICPTALAVARADRDYIGLSERALGNYWSLSISITWRLIVRHSYDRASARNSTERRQSGECQTARCLSRRVRRENKVTRSQDVDSS